MVDRWTSVAARLCDQLSMELASLDPAQASRCTGTTCPSTCGASPAWRLRSVSAPGVACPPLVVGLSAPQGCGKTTLVPSSPDCSAAGPRAASVSIDDVHLTGAEQEELANKNPTNPLLRFGATPGPTTSSWACAR